MQQLLNFDNFLPRWAVLWEMHSVKYHIILKSNPTDHKLEVVTHTDWKFKFCVHTDAGHYKIFAKALDVSAWGSESWHPVLGSFWLLGRMIHFLKGLALCYHVCFLSQNVPASCTCACVCVCALCMYVAHNQCWLVTVKQPLRYVYIYIYMLALLLPRPHPPSLHIGVLPNQKELPKSITSVMTISGCIYIVGVYI